MGFSHVDKIVLVLSFLLCFGIHHWMRPLLVDVFRGVSGRFIKGHENTTFTKSLILTVICWGGAFFVSHTTLFSIIPLSALFVALYTLSEVDYKTHLIPDTLQFLGLASVLTFTAIEVVDNPERLEVFTYFVIMNVIQISILILLSLLYKKFRSKSPMGFGDIKLLAWTGLLVNGQSFTTILLAAVLYGLVYVFSSKETSEAPDNNFAFGPYISAAFVLLLVFGV